MFALEKPVAEACSESSLDPHIQHKTYTVDVTSCLQEWGVTVYLGSQGSQLRMAMMPPALTPFSDTKLGFLRDCALPLMIMIIII